MMVKRFLLCLLLTGAALLLSGAGAPGGGEGAAGPAPAVEIRHCGS